MGKRLREIEVVSAGSLAADELECLVCCTSVEEEEEVGEGLGGCWID